MCCASLIEIERICILHQEFAAAHQPKAGADLITELPLNVIEIERDILVGTHIGTENFSDHFFVGWPIKHVTFVPILYAQHFLAIRVVASALTPEVRRLNRGH
jgi:hypothetical protein